MSGRADGERRVNMIRCWFAAGSLRWAGNAWLAHEIFSENVRANGFAAGVPDLAKDMRAARELPRSPAIEICSRSAIKLSRGWRGTEPIPAHMGVEATGKRVEFPDFADWRLECAM
jgi:hypothetical protein